MDFETPYDCIVVGSGHAGSCAALSAVESGCKRVFIVDKCPPEWVGGNGYFTAGAHRTVHGGLSDLCAVASVPRELGGKIEMASYSREEFVNDIMRLSDNRSDRALVDAVVDNSRSAIEWLKSKAGIPFVFSFHRQAYQVNGVQKFWGGMVLSVEDGGKGLIEAHQRALKAAGVHIEFNTPAVAVLRDTEGSIQGIEVEHKGQQKKIFSRTVVLAAGGFEANAELRKKHLGPHWEKAKVRGTGYNNGDGFAIAAAVSAKFSGDWSGCHSTCWDAAAPDDSGTRDVTNQYTKSGYPLGIMVNSKGERFVDCGEDFRNYTYAKFGRAILYQPGGYAFQIWDSKAISYLRKEEYGDNVVERIMADSPNSLADKLVSKGLEDKDRFLETLRHYNRAVEQFRTENRGLVWNPAVKDGLSTKSLVPPKSNWALTIDEKPFMAVKVASGVTFTFGGVCIDPETAGVISQETSKLIPGLYCTGEMVGGLFYNNYPGGSGLTAGAVFGIKAGREAGKRRQS